MLKPPWLKFTEERKNHLRKNILKTQPIHLNSKLKKRNRNPNLLPNDLSPVSKRKKKKARVQSSIKPLSAEEGDHLVGRRTVICSRQSSAFVSLGLTQGRIRKLQQINGR